MTWGMIGGAAVSVVGGALLSKGGGGGGGGSGGGSSPPVYEMTNSPGMDTNFQNSYTDYQNNVNANQLLTNPMARQLLQNQWSNPYQNDLMSAAHNAQIGYGTGANQTAVSSQYLGQTADALMGLQSQQQGRFNANYGATQQDSNNLRQMGMDSNNAYNALIAQQQGQLGNINASSNGLYGAGSNALQTTNQLTDFLKAQQGNVQSGMNQGNQAGANAYNTTNDLVGMQAAQAGNAYGQANQLYGSASQLQNDAFDPQRALYERNVGQLQENVRAGEYARGLQMSPAGASIEADAMENFQNTWQNQQLAREAQGVNAANGAAQSAQGLTNNFANNVSGLQSQGYSTGLGQYAGAQGLADQYSQNIASVQGRGYATSAGADQSAQGMQNSYSDMMSALQNNKNAQYANMSQAANANMSSFLNNQSNNANAGASAIGNAYQNQGSLASQSAGLYGEAGQYPYSAYQQMTGNQYGALQNYNTAQQPYLTGLVQNQNSALGYINHAAGLQNQGFNQNAYNQNQMQNSIGSLAGPVSKAFQQYMGGGYNYNNGGSSYTTDPAYQGNQLFNPANFADGYGTT